MSTNFEVLEQEALKLSADERAALAQRLISSLDEQDDVDDAWAAEVERRVSAVERGEIQDIPIAEALARLRAAAE